MHAVRAPSIAPHWPYRYIVMNPVTASVVSHQQIDMVAMLLADLNQHCHGTIEKVVLTCNLPEPPPFTPTDFKFRLEILNNAQPLGFGANHNQAFRRCETDWFLVLNPDVRIQSDVINALLNRATPSTGLLAPQERDAHGALVENLRGLITPWELVLRNVFKQVPPPMRFGWVKGMFMLTRSETYRAVNGFDPRYFMYCEDFDLCARMMLSGWTIDLHRDINVTHSWQRTSHSSYSHLKHHLRSLWRMWISAAFWSYRRLLRRTIKQAPDI